MPERPETATEAMIRHAADRLRAAPRCETPFRHWLPQEVLATELCQDVVGLPLAPADTGHGDGTRASQNAGRVFASPAMRAAHPPLDTVATIFQSRPVVQAIEAMCGVDFGGSQLRVEYCRDSGEFWLEPHLDIAEKLITLQIYLNTGADAPALGTDFYDAAGRHLGRSRGEMGQALAFLPKQADSWHGFERRVINGVRRSLIVNYVTGAWRSRHELSFPEQPQP